MQYCINRLAAVLTIALLWAIPSPLVMAQTPPAPTAPKVQVELPAKDKLPSSPGYFSITCQVTVDQQHLPMGFALFLPAGYFRSKEPFPIIMTLHNKGLEGSMAGGLAGEGMARLWVRDDWDSRNTLTPPDNALVLRKNAQFIGISPQCPANYAFEDEPMPHILAELATQLAKAYRADDDRVYLTGFSAGGLGTWQVAEQTPKRWAAIVPLSCRLSNDPAKTVQALKDMPIYLGTGTEDWALPFCQQWHEALKVAGHTNFVFHITPGGTHWAYHSIYTDPMFMDWLFSQKRRK
jgi:predicted peptidase